MINMMGGLWTNLEDDKLVKFLFFLQNRFDFSGSLSNLFDGKKKIASKCCMQKFTLNSNFKCAG